MLVFLGLGCFLEGSAISVGRPPLAFLTNVEKCNEECEKKFDVGHLKHNCILYECRFYHDCCCYMELFHVKQ